MKKTLIIFWQLLRINIKKSLIYRANFLITIVALFLWVSVYIIFFEVLFLHVDQIAGWSKGEMLTVLGYYYIAMSIGNIFYRDGFEVFGEEMRQGKIDHILTKPAPTKIMLFFRDIRFDHALDLIFGGLIFVYIFTTTDVPFSWQLMLLGLGMALIAQMLFFGMLMGLASIVFFVDRLESIGSFVWHVSQVSRYPRQIFTGVAKIAFQIVFPVALVASIPAETTLGVAPPNLLLAFTVASVTVLLLGNLAFELGLRRYHSAN